MIREIVLDTETTGLDPADGHRLVELGCVELVNHLRTGRDFHSYINPEREVPEDARRIHGLSTDFLRGYPVFVEVVDAFLEFIGDSPLLIHNAKFDMAFLNAELARAGRGVLATNRATCTLLMAQKRFPGAPASLDALCRRFSVDNSVRTKHGAIVDSELLAEVYLHLPADRPGARRSHPPGHGSRRRGADAATGTAACSQRGRACGPRRTAGQARRSDLAALIVVGG
jgi:DNA polymerase-3 subunit epsilon